MLRREFAPAKRRERASWRCGLPLATPNFNKQARTGSSMTARIFFWVLRRPARNFCLSAFEQNSPKPGRKAAIIALRDGGRIFYPHQPAHSYSNPQEITPEAMLDEVIGSSTIQESREKRFTCSYAIRPPFLAPRKDTFSSWGHRRKQCPHRLHPRKCHRRPPRPRRGPFTPHSSSPQCS